MIFLSELAQNECIGANQSFEATAACFSFLDTATARMHVLGMHRGNPVSATEHTKYTTPHILEVPLRRKWLLLVDHVELIKILPRSTELNMSIQ